MFDNELVYRVYQEVGMFTPEWFGVLNHSLGVSHVAGHIARLIVDQGTPVDIAALETGTALHDAGKPLEQKGAAPKDHVLVITEKLHYHNVDDAIIKIVAHHEPWAFGDDLTWRPNNIEEEIAMISDCAFSSNVVPIGQRLNDIITRYQFYFTIESENWFRELVKGIHHKLATNIQNFPYAY